MIRETLREVRLQGVKADTPGAPEEFKQKKQAKFTEKEADEISRQKKAEIHADPARQERIAAEKAAVKKKAAAEAAAGEAGATPEQQQQAQAGTQQQQAASKPAMRGVRTEVEMVVRLMGKNAQIKKLFPKIRANEIMKAQFFAVMADQLGVPPDELSPLVVKIKAQQKKQAKKAAQQ